MNWNILVIKKKKLIKIPKVVVSEHGKDSIFYMLENL